MMRGAGRLRPDERIASAVRREAAVRAARSKDAFTISEDLRKQRETKFARQCLIKVCGR
jgi:hypothetical protein